MNIVFIKYFFVGLIVSEILRMFVFGYFTLYIYIYREIIVTAISELII